MIVRTKLIAPRLSQRHVARAGVVAQARSDTQARVVSIVAPAGFGKSTALAELLVDGGGFVALDAEDDEPHRFWAYVGHALHAAAGIDSRGMADALLAAHPPTLDTALATWTNALMDVAQPCVLALDDLHVVSDPAVLRDLTRFVERLPPTLQIVFAARRAPALPLARWRAAGELVELDATTLQLSTDEAVAFFGRRVDPPVSADHVRTLVSKTEGWAVGLQLAAASLCRGGDYAATVADFGGQRSDVAAYLTEQIVDAHDEATRSFLLDVSALEALTPEACAAVAGRSDAGEVVERLERDNVPLQRLGDGDRGYRLHHLLGEHLRALAKQRDPERVRACHRRAAAYAASRGDHDAAFRHTIEAGDLEAATDRMTVRAERLIRASRPSAVLRDVRRLGLGLSALPSALVLSIAYAAYLCARPTELRAALTVLHGRRAQQQVDDEVWAQVCNLRSALARASGDYAAAVALADEGLALEPATPGGLLLYRSVAELLLGRVGDASRTAAACLAVEPTAGPPTFIGVTAQSLLAQARIEQARLGEANTLCDAIRQRLVAHALGDAPMMAVVERTSARIALERGRWAEARAALQRARRAAAASGLGDLHAVVLAWLGHWALLTDDDALLDTVLAELEPATGRDAWLRGWHAALVARRDLALGRGGAARPAGDAETSEAWAMVELRRLPQAEAAALGETLLTRAREQGRLTTAVAVEVSLAE
ncbi:MAG: hypothetical protein AAF721_24890, partial [Myxococcota bacterium]